MTRISPGVARTVLGLNLKHATFFLTHPGVVVDDEDHHGELQPEQEMEVAPALGHGAGLSRGQLLHLLPSSAGPSPSSSLNHPASPGAPTHYYLQYSEGIINQRLYPPSCGVASWCPCCAAVCLLLVRPGSCAGWCAPSKPPRHHSTPAALPSQDPHQAAHRGMGQRGYTFPSVCEYSLHSCSSSIALKIIL